MILLHEMFHGKHFKNDKSKYIKDTEKKNEQYDNEEEKNSIDETNQASKELGNGDGGNGADKKRTSHKEGKTFKAKSTTSNEE